MATNRLLVVSDVHFFNPQYFQHVVQPGGGVFPPSRLSTDIPLGDPKANPFHALLLLARTGEVSADALICCGDVTSCADPTAMNFGWLQLHRLAAALKVDEPLVTSGNHDIDSRFKISTTSPHRMLQLLDPPFPTANNSAQASYWGNGYCVIDRSTDLRFVLVNTCSLHGYSTERDRQLDHGSIPEQLFEQLPSLLRSMPKRLMNVLVCHHHPIEIGLPSEDQSVIDNGGELVELLTSLSPPGWLVIHGHRHLPAVQYASADAKSPIIFSAGSLAANLHLRLQGRTANQFYVLVLEADATTLRGTYEAWTWDQQEGEWLRGQNYPALAAKGGFGYRPDVSVIATDIEKLVPPHASGSSTWKEIENKIPALRFLLLQHRVAILDTLAATHQIDWESDSQRSNVDASQLRIGRRM